LSELQSAVVGVAVDGNSTAFSLVYSNCIESVVLSIHINSTAVEVNGLSASDTVIGRFDLNSTAVESDAGNRLNSFVFGIDIEVTAIDFDITNGFVFDIGGLDTVAESVELESTVIDYEVVLTLDSVVNGIDFDRTAVDSETVLGVDTAGVVGIDDNGALTVDNEVFLGENSRIGFVISRIIEFILAAVGQGVYRTVVESENSFLSLPDHDAGTVIIGDACAVENEVQLTCVNAVNIDLTVVEGAGDIVCTCCGDGDLSVFAYINSSGITGNGITCENDFGSVLERNGFTAFISGGSAGSKHCRGRNCQSSEKHSKNFLHFIRLTRRFR